MNWDAEVDVIVVGGGGAGLVSALSLAQEGLEVALFEKTKFLLGNTAASAGMVPACNTKFQKAMGIGDPVDQMVEDIMYKNKNEANREQVRALAEVSAALVEWMNDSLHIEMSVVDEFKYPGHTNFRMHAPPSRSGLELMKLLKRNAQEYGDNLYILYESDLQQLLVEDGKVIGIRVLTGDGEQFIKGQKVILATNGFGGNKELVEKYIPEIADALYFGYEANTGTALECGIEIGAATKHLTGYQGHAAVNENTGLLVTWGTIMMGGFYVNTDGQRFGNEASGYSEFAKEVLKQPNQHGYIIYDQAIHEQLQTIEDYKQITEMEAYKSATTIEELATLIDVPSDKLAATFEAFSAVENGEADAFGRTSFARKLQAPLYAIKVSPALFHTQGGLLINEHAQVVSENGQIIENLYAAGGSAAGVSGDAAYGYMSGNGLLAALGFGYISALHIKQELAAKQQ